MPPIETNPFRNMTAENNSAEYGARVSAFSKTVTTEKTKTTKTV